MDLSFKYHNRVTPKFPGLGPEFRDDLVLEVSLDGEILREIFFFDVLYANDLIGSMFPKGITRMVGDSMDDLLHANDVEILSAEDLHAFLLFKSGDVLVSLWNLNLLIAFDPGSRMVKWSQTGPWLRQHDPDFLLDGRILEFDNRDDPTAV